MWVEASTELPTITVAATLFLICVLTCLWMVARYQFVQERERRLTLEKQLEGERTIIGNGSIETDSGT